MKLLGIVIFFIVIGKIVEANDSSPIVPIPKNKNLSQKEMEKVLLGEKLFKEKKLSKDNSISCLSCHNLSQGGDDGEKVAVGLKKRSGSVNTPTILNSSFNFKQFWDGRANDLSDQIDGPIHNPIEMGTNWEEVTSKLNKDPAYVKDFLKVFNAKISSARIVESIVAYETTLITPDSRFDKFLRGDKNAITKEEQEGYSKFKSYGCISCHQGVNIGGNMFQTMGVARNFFKERGNIQISDYGLYNVTKQIEDLHVFKVPSLRNVTETAPYFHDGSAKNLEEAIYIMGRYQLGRELSKKDIKSIILFLGTIKGSLPKSGNKASR